MKADVSKFPKLEKQFKVTPKPKFIIYKVELIQEGVLLAEVNGADITKIKEVINKNLPPKEIE